MKATVTRLPGVGAVAELGVGVGAGVCVSEGLLQPANKAAEQRSKAENIFIRVKVSSLSRQFAVAPGNWQTFYNSLQN
jgi:hypothetical protein